ncbi:glycoside hydrolase family 65 protein [Dyella mobilis]|uniref:Glycoside hydrolase family 65 protein n=1 Tax=Dyella mobilis TaxID=1849582 RepID=A0ABS2KAL6_9GAMM|nr:glycoside hydrolase family 65 protein [Dyella mobilis]MBM7128226.1 glycoside hydrolase family 65 protein [Dyella mobilis]GLQ99786.1 kojibiose phosphorylase [Dyella mobilis]
MRFERNQSASFATLVLGCVFASCAWGATDPSFLLGASDGSLPGYFPGELANGYVSTLTAPRGTEGNLSYVVAFMDRTQGDVSRPAAIPGWTGIDYSTGPSRRGQAWLNQASLDPAHFQHYGQLLDMYNGVLTTHYRYIDGPKSTQVSVATLVSQASPHLAASQLSITPDFDGEVELSFTLDLWAPHQPRLALAKLDGQQMQEAVAANNLALQASAPATPDRAALWYHGDTRVVASGGDTKTLTLWLDGQAERGAKMAQAVAIALPAGMQASDVQLQKSEYRLALKLRVAVQRGHSYAFTKYVAISRDHWGGDAKQDLALVTAARTNGYDDLLNRHETAWHALWQSDIAIQGDPQAQLMVHSDLYYLLANSTPDTAWPIGACGLTPGYTGHVFWDGDAWIFPALLLLHPERAKSLVMFRANTLKQAQERAHARGLQGAMYPWEADPDDGTSQTPHFASVLDEREIHVNADIAIAQWQYYLATQDRDWLQHYGWPVIRAVADFWAHRATYNASQHRYDIQHVTSVDEDYSDVPNDTFTNASARKALDIATAAATVLNEKPDPHWAEVAKGLYLPFAQQDGHYLDFDPSVPHDLDSWGASSLPKLSMPSLDLPMDPEVRQRNYAYAIAAIAHSRHDPNSMGFAPLSIAAATAGDEKEATAWFQRFLVGHVLKAPFNVRTETATNNTGYFMTASGGMLQNILFGFTGLRIEQDGLVQAYPPMLPAGWNALTLKHISFRGEHYDVELRRDAQGKVSLTRHGS